uniref:Uncharacterized protein n=1 Tax=Oryza brachyantha TaxID=4533 RepID=J3M8J7_ORYBR
KVLESSILPAELNFFLVGWKLQLAGSKHSDLSSSSRALHVPGVVSLLVSVSWIL